MRGGRALLTALVQVVALTALVGSSPAATVEGPVVAISNDRGIVAWTENDFIRVADEKPGGHFGPGFAVGRIFGTASPALAANSHGTTVVVWAYGLRLHWARRDAPGSWRWGVVPRIDAAEYAQLSVVVDESGVATMALADRGVPVGDDAVTAPEGGTVGGSKLFVMTQAPGGDWADASTNVPVAVSPAVALDSAGDALIAYRAGAGIFAITRLAGSDAWGEPELISGADAVSSTHVLVAGGGARTFAVSWNAVPAGGPPAAMRAARLRLPGTFAAPLSVVAPGSVDPSGQAVAYMLGHTIAVDPFGNALAGWQFPATGLGGGVATALLPASADGFTAPTVIDAPTDRDAGDSPPSIAFGDDGAVQLAFVRRGGFSRTLRVAAAPSAFGGWQGADVDALVYPGCVTGPICAQLPAPPVIVQRGSTTVIATPATSGLSAVTRTPPFASWSYGYTQVPPAAGSTVAVSSAPVRRGVARIYARCALPPCTGTVVMWPGNRVVRILGDRRISMPGVRAVSIRIALTSYARGLLAHRPRLRVILELRLHEADGTTQRVTADAVLNA